MDSMGSSHSASRRPRRRRNSYPANGSSLLIMETSPTSPTTSSILQEQQQAHVQNEYGGGLSNHSLPRPYTISSGRRSSSAPISPMADRDNIPRSSSSSSSFVGPTRQIIRPNNEDESSRAFTEDMIGNPFEIDPPPPLNVPRIGNAPRTLQLPHDSPSTSADLAPQQIRRASFIAHLPEFYDEGETERDDDSHHHHHNHNHHVITTDQERKESQSNDTLTMERDVPRQPLEQQELSPTDQNENENSNQYISRIPDDRPTIDTGLPALVSPLPDSIDDSVSFRETQNLRLDLTTEYSNENGSSSVLLHNGRGVPTNDTKSRGGEEDYFALPPDLPPRDFFPQGSLNSEWMGRSLETLILGYGRVAPILRLPEITDESPEGTLDWGRIRRRSTRPTSPLGHRASSIGKKENRRGSLVGHENMRGGTLARYYSRRRGAGNDSYGTRQGRNDGRSFRRRSVTPPQGLGMAMNQQRGSTSNGPTYRRRTRLSHDYGIDFAEESSGSSSKPKGPNIALSLLARETTGRLPSRNVMFPSNRLRSMGGQTLVGALDRPAGGICSEVAALTETIDRGDWNETQAMVSRLTPRLIGDPAAAANGQSPTALNDPNLPATASRFYAGGGRLGLERDAFVMAGGVDVFIRIFREPRFVGEKMAESFDARNLSREVVANRLSMCWNDVLASLRELVFAIPSLVEHGTVLGEWEFVPFLFTLMAHDSCFDGAAALIEEILSLQSHSLPHPYPEGSSLPDDNDEAHLAVRVPPPTTFFLGNVPDLYSLWGGFNCRQLAHFCRVLALVVFEPGDRQLLASPALLKSVELLQLRRNRAARAGRDSTVDMNQAIVLGDEVLIERLLKLLRIMNFAPHVSRSAAFHVMAHFPIIADSLVMLGLNELENWNEVDNLEALARSRADSSSGGGTNGVGGERQVNELGSVAEMLENLAETLQGNRNEVQVHTLGHIMNVVRSAQQAGVVGRHRQGQPRQSDEDDGTTGNAIDDLMAAPFLGGDPLSRPRFQINPVGQVVVVGNDGEGGTHFQGLFGGYVPPGHPRPRLLSPQDAANSLQFNALLLGPYQVEVLFVLCTLLGGRRKIDAQEMLNSLKVIPILEDMFQRLPWDSLSPTREPVLHRNRDDGSGRRNQPNVSGVHGPSCDCTPESALCVQYLRLLHNFCDRDCDNYTGRRLLLSDAERTFMFRSPPSGDYILSGMRPGLLSQIIAAFMGESDESSYRFWLASCVESYLRGSSSDEQVFVAHTGLLRHLINDVTSQRLHCAGSLQTSFDLLGELCKGNAEVLRLLAVDLDEESFRKLMSVAAANLVDSNVFIRSLILSLERISCSNNLMPLHLEQDFFVDRPPTWRSKNGVFCRSYLTHSWWDSYMVNLNAPGKDLAEEESWDAMRSADWFPSRSTINTLDLPPSPPEGTSTSRFHHDGSNRRLGWIFTPSEDSMSTAHAPNTVERLSWFLAVNQTRLLCDLLTVVDLTNINHENICCLNTAVVVAIFAFRRKRLDALLQDLRRCSEAEFDTKRPAVPGGGGNVRMGDDPTFLPSRKDGVGDPASSSAYARHTPRVVEEGGWSNTTSEEENGKEDRDVLRNFREVLWFWTEYYTHRGRDRLSLEFSSHLRFQEWIDVVTLLGADDGSPTSLVRSPVRLPRSPYQCATRVTDGLQRSG